MRQGRHHFNLNTINVSIDCLNELSSEMIKYTEKLRTKTYNDLFPEQIADDIALFNSYVKAVSGLLKTELEAKSSL